MTNEIVQRVAATMAKVAWPHADLANDNDFSDRERAEYYALARAAIEETLRAIREPGEDTIEAGAFEAMPSDYWAATIIEQSKIAALAHWKAMIDQLLSSIGTPS